MHWARQDNALVPNRRHSITVLAPRKLGSMGSWALYTRSLSPPSLSSPLITVSAGVLCDLGGTSLSVTSAAIACSVFDTQVDGTSLAPTLTLTVVLSVAAIPTPLRFSVLDPRVCGVDVTACPESQGCNTRSLSTGVNNRVVLEQHHCQNETQPYIKRTAQRLLCFSSTNGL